MAGTGMHRTLCGPSRAGIMRRRRRQERYTAPIGSGRVVTTDAELASPPAALNRLVGHFLSPLLRRGGWIPDGPAGGVLHVA